MTNDRIMRLLQGCVSGTLSALLETLRYHHFDGNVVIHFRGGKPFQMEVGRPTQIAIFDDPPREGVDKPQQEAAHSAPMR